MPALDVYRITDKLDDGTSEVLVKRLEARGQHPVFVEMMHQYFDTMRIDETRRVLDLGCGTGVAGRSILGRPNFRGEVTGIDLSPYLIRVGSDLATKEGFARRMHFRVGNTHKLATTDGELCSISRSQTSAWSSPTSSHLVLDHLEQLYRIVQANPVNTVTA